MQKMANAKNNISLLHYLSIFFFFQLLFICCSINQENKNVLVVTGGKKIERESFLNIFNSMENIEYKEVIQPQANKIYSKNEIDNYDAIIFYDFVQEITEDQKKAFLKLLDKGKGMIFLHHSLVSYQSWDEYEKIVGGRYYQSTNKEDSIKYVQSTFKHDVEIPVKIINKNQTITKGINDFVIHNEVYGKYKILPNIKPIISTTYPESEDIIGWTNNYKNSKIVYIQLGHDHHAFNDPNYQKMIKQSIYWVSSN